MSDLRNTQSSDPQANRFGLGDHMGGEPPMNYQLNDNTIESIPVFEDSGGLSSVHRSEEEWREPGTRRNKIIGGLVIALLLGAAGAWTFVTLNNTPKEMVADNRLPQTAEKTAAAPAPAPAPMPSQTMTAPAPAPAAAPEATTPKTIKPVTRQARETPRAASKTPQTLSAPAPIVMPPQNQAATPEPVSPAPPAASQAGIPAPGEQSAGEPAAPPSDVAPAPATQPTPEGPAPAQADGQPQAPAPQ